jgi:hypothetical protein
MVACSASDSVSWNSLTPGETSIATLPRHLVGVRGGVRRAPAVSLPRRGVQCGLFWNTKISR